MYDRHGMTREQAIRIALEKVKKYCLDNFKDGLDATHLFCYSSAGGVFHYIELHTNGEIRYGTSRDNPSTHSNPLIETYHDIEERSNDYLGEAEILLRAWKNIKPDFESAVSRTMWLYSFEP